MSSPDWFGALIGLGGVVAFFAGLGLLIWLEQRHKLRMRQLEKEEHLGLAERGLTEYLEQLTRTSAEKTRCAAAGAIGVSVGLGLPASGTLATLFLSMGKDQTLFMVPLIVLWVTVPVTVLVTSILCLRALRPIVPPAPTPAATASGIREPAMEKELELS